MFVSLTKDQVYFLGGDFQCVSLDEILVSQLSFCGNSLGDISADGLLVRNTQKE